MPDIKEYLRLQEQRTRIKQELNKLFGRDFASLLRDFEREIDRMFAESGNRLLLTSQDFSQIVENFIRELVRRQEFNLQSGRASLIDLNERIKKALEFIYPIDYQLFPRKVLHPDGLVREVGALLKKYRNGDITESVVRRRIKQRFGTPVHHANTFVNTQLAGWDNTTAKTLADLSGLRKATYMGPLSANTRPFCINLLGSGQLYTEKQIREMDNGQGLPVIRYCGGYNCMHEWVWVDEEWPEVTDLK